MVLIRLIVLKGLIDNVRIFAKHVKGSRNIFADSLSRDKIQHFKELCVEHRKFMKEKPVEVPHAIWPVEKKWKL